MYRKHRKFFSFVLFFIFALFFLYLIYDRKYNVFFPKPPAVSYIITSSDSTSFTNVLLYDFENVKDHSLVTNEKAFSGKNALKVSGKRVSSPPVQITFTKKNLQQITEASFGAWIYVDDSSKKLDGKLVFQIVDKSNKLKFSAASDIKEQKPKANMWFYICGKAEWEKCKVLPEDFAKIYFWNNSNNTVYIDNMQVIFGRQKIKGLKSLTNNSTENNNYSPLKNQPPYPVIFFEKEFIGNTKNTSVILPDGKASLELTSEDAFFKGNFIRSKAGTEQLMVFRDEKPYALLWYESQQSQLLFTKLSSENFPGSCGHIPPLAADVNGDGTDEIIYIADNSTDIQVFDYNSVSRKLILISKENSSISISIQHIQKFHSKAGHGESLFVIDDKDEAFLLNFEKNKWDIKFLGYLAEAAQIKYESNIVSGNFIKAGGNDNILILYRDKNSGRCFFKLFDIDTKSGKNSCLLQGNFDNRCDTLYPQNKYFSCDIDNDNVSELISCSNGWRYDTKLVKFDKDGYIIIANIDFTGYPKDYNPKYFEKLTMVEANFIEKNNISFFTFCGSTKNSYKDMPPYIGLFSYNNKTTKP